MLLQDIQNDEKHQSILGFFHVLLSLYLGFTSRGKVYTSGYSIYTGETSSSWQPDLLIVLSEHYDRIQTHYLEGAADIAIEITSYSTEIADRGQKFMEYEAIGISEYWIIDPIRQEIVIYTLNQQRRYQRIKGTDNQIISKMLPNFVLDSAILWQDELPVGAQVIKLVWAMLKSYIKIVNAKQLQERVL